jgi:hypothetical protein
MKIEYEKPTELRSLGRNRYVTTAGLVIGSSSNTELLLWPLNTRGAPSIGCRIVVPMTAAPAVADALIAQATPTLHDQLGYWPIPRKTEDHDLLLAIQNELDGTSWDADTLETIATLMQAGGYRIRDKDDRDVERTLTQPAVCDECGGSPIDDTGPHEPFCSRYRK